MVRRNTFSQHPSLHCTALQAMEKDVTGLKKKNKTWSKAEVKAEAERLRGELQGKHEQELAALRAALAGDGGETTATAAVGVCHASASASASALTAATATAGAGDESDATMSRAAKRRTKKEAEARAREAELDRHHAALAAAGGSRRERELTALQMRLSPLGRVVVPMPADGSCMFHAVADQLRESGGVPGLPTGLGGVARLRGMAADHIQAESARMGPYLPFEDADGDFATDPDTAVRSYCDRLRSTAAWGGQPEARALCEALCRAIVIHRASGAPLIMEPSASATAPAAPAAPAEAEDAALPEGSLHLTFHEHFISSGEHYNSARRAGEAAAT